MSGSNAAEGSLAFNSKNTANWNQCPIYRVLSGSGPAMTCLGRAPYIAPLHGRASFANQIDFSTCPFLENISLTIFKVEQNI
jgi:hypothetical protein